ncbi:hypothetical protein Lmac_2961 [Legionella maceachernii]|uniref:UPF0102 protein Lmac_2961 n=2 Tax=Legionellaceae TaxID=444 RepID=A0A0W0VVL6_9GAMM|nr:hypothetical protein Lmac_2961 [Legionella maceachernii]SJZ85893.1 putative endonuclease [Legionella maceachernii]SUO99080.1 Uncharacterised protein family UPF0102 [Legionella maceachernii]
MSLKTGTKAELWARDYLLRQGLRWISSNYRCRWGEIDLIMEEQNCLVFVEVRSRQSRAFGGAIASITSVKQHKLAKAAAHYLQTTKKYNAQPVRFDVVGFEEKGQHVEWIKNAFEVAF